jgi:hypothetical protein
MQNTFNMRFLVDRPDRRPEGGGSIRNPASTPISGMVMSGDKIGDLAELLRPHPHRCAGFAPQA